jgi:hypothetical protein
MPPYGNLPAHARSARRFAAAVSLAAALAAGMAPGTRPQPSDASETTVSQDPMRTGWDQNETAMSPADVTGFTQLFRTYVTGQVWAQPLVVGSTVIVATEKDYLYGLDAATGAIKWTTKLGQFYTISSCNDLAPDVGVTGGPVYDPGTNAVYVMAQIKPGKHPLYSLFGINPGNGKITESVGVPPRPSNDSHLTFSGTNEMARPGLLLVDGWVYAAFGSHCDHKPYVGYVAGVNVSTHARTMWADETGTSNNQAGIWQGGGGLMSDGSGRIFLTSGNGISPAPATGKKPPGQLAESVVRLGKNSAGTLSARDFFSPDNAPKLDAADTDWGSGGPVGLPLGTGTYPNVLAQVGKDGRIFLLNRNNLGGRNAKNNNAALSVTPAFNGEWGHPAVFAGTPTLNAGNAAGASDYLYYIGKNDKLRYLKFGVNGSDAPTLADVGNTSVTFGYSSGSPTVTSSGASAASTVVWAIYANNSTGGGGTLEAFPGAPTGCSTAQPCTVQPIKSWPIGTASKFSNLATSGNRVYVGTRAGLTSSGGTVYGFGAAAPAAPVAPAAQTTFGQTPVNATATRDVTITANSTLTVTGVTASTGATGDNTAASQFTVSGSKAALAPVTGGTPKPGASTAAPSSTRTATPHDTSTSTTAAATGAAAPRATGAAARMPVRFPVTLHKGDKLSVPVAFSPSAPGGATGAVTFATSAGPQTVAVAGTATTPGLYASQATVPFALVNDIGQPVSDVPDGIQVPREIDIVNGGSTPVKIDSVSPPSGPYTAAGLPRPGTTLQPGQSTVVQVVFAPTAPGSYLGSLSMSGSDGSTVTVHLTGTGLAPASLFKASPAAVDFGAVPVGQQKTAVITLTNTGNEPATVVATSVLTGPFRRIIHMAPQLPVNSAYQVRAPIAFTPRRKGTFSTTYTFTWTDVTGTHSIAVRLTGRGT